jgi:hypothetical protein
MHLLEAHGQLASMADPPELPCSATYAGEDIYPTLATALALLSGWLDEATTPADLIEAVEQGSSLLTAGVISPKQVRRATFDIIRTLLAWGDERMEPVMPPDGVNLLANVGPCWVGVRREKPLPENALCWTWQGAQEAYSVQCWPWKATNADKESLPAPDAAGVPRGGGNADSPG